MRLGGKRGRERAVQQGCLGAVSFLAEKPVSAPSLFSSLALSFSRLVPSWPFSSVCFSFGSRQLNNTHTTPPDANTSRRPHPPTADLAFSLPRPHTQTQTPPLSHSDSDTPALTLHPSPTFPPSPPTLLSFPLPPRHNQNATQGGHMPRAEPTERLRKLEEAHARIAAEIQRVKGRAAQEARKTRHPPKDFGRGAAARSGAAGRMAGGAISRGAG